MPNTTGDANYAKYLANCRTPEVALVGGTLASHLYVPVSLEIRYARVAAFAGQQIRQK